MLQVDKKKKLGKMNSVVK
uniref:Uncharacterized protein n=1 Tax=Rhizophora mucronata TaxID=61149 RepID=A0A2P2J2M2_RHIMU